MARNRQSTWQHRAMARHPRLLTPPIAFAHRGARAQAPENTIEAFTLARRLGATGLESDAWLSADGEVVLDHDGRVGGWLRRRPFATINRSRLPAHVPTLEQLYAEVGTDLHLSLDIKDADAGPSVIEIARAHGASDRLWMCHPDWTTVASWRDLHPEVKLVDSTRRSRMDRGPEVRAAQLAEAGVDAVNLHHSDWTGGMVTLFHRFELACFGWDAQLPRHLASLLDMGIDGVYSDHVDRMMAAVSAADRSEEAEVREGPDA